MKVLARAHIAEARLRRGVMSIPDRRVKLMW
jgi:hypothetical protein